MDALMAMLESLATGGAGPRIVLIAFAGIAVAAFAFGVGSLAMGVADPIRRRLGLRKAAAPAGAVTSRVSSAVEPIARYVLPTNEAERSRIRRQLQHAGFRSPNALSVYYAAKTSLVLLLPLLVFLAMKGFPKLSTGEVMFWCIAAGAFGIFLPNVVLDRFVQRRLKELRNGFPDALDLLVVCVESGLGLSAAIQRVADEMEVSHPRLAAELSLVTAEMRAGVDRELALKNLAERSGLEDIRGLVSLLVQTMRFGTGVADTLRVYSEEFRDKRMQKAEELAAKMGTKLIFPLILCLFPGFFIVAVGPAVMKLVEAFRIMGN